MSDDNVKWCRLFFLGYKISVDYFNNRKFFCLAGKIEPCYINAQSETRWEYARKINKTENEIITVNGKKYKLVEEK